MAAPGWLNHKPIERQDKVDAMAEPLAKWDRALTEVIAANREQMVAVAKLRRQVSLARRSGHSWAAIGFTLGISRQAAQQRFGRPAGDE